MRPITQQIVTESLRIFNSKKWVNEKDIVSTLVVSKNRGNEILNQLFEMNIIDKKGELYCINSNGEQIFFGINSDNFYLINQILEKYKPYYELKNYLENIPSTRNELSQKFNYTMVEVDIILRLIAWCNLNFSKNIENERYYFQSEIKPDLCDFMNELIKIYFKLINDSYFGIKNYYVEISKVENYLCEILGVKKEIIKELFIDTIKNNNSLIEVVSAPSLTINKKSMKPYYLKDKLIPYYFLRLNLEAIKK